MNVITVRDGQLQGEACERIRQFRNRGQQFDLDTDGFQSTFDGQEGIHHTPAVIVVLAGRSPVCDGVEHDLLQFLYRKFGIGAPHQSHHTCDVGAGHRSTAQSGVTASCTGGTNIHTRGTDVGLRTTSAERVAVDRSARRERRHGEAVS